MKEVKEVEEEKEKKKEGRKMYINSQQNLKNKIFWVQEFFF